MKNPGKFLLNLAVRLRIFLLNQILKPFLPKKKLEALSHKLIMHILASRVSTRLGKDALILKFNSLDSTDPRSDSTVQTKTNQEPELISEESIVYIRFVGTKTSFLPRVTLFRGKELGLDMRLQ